ncbi:unnamed protein product, partial [Ectocarpus sp. 12 AP-2014]
VLNKSDATAVARPHDRSLSRWCQCLNATFLSTKTAAEQHAVLHARPRLRPACRSWITVLGTRSRNQHSFLVSHSSMTPGRNETHDVLDAAKTRPNRESQPRPCAFEPKIVPQT